RNDSRTRACTLVLEPGLRVCKIYNGFWFFRRPTVELSREAHVRLLPVLERKHHVPRAGPARDRADRRSDPGTRRRADPHGCRPRTRCERPGVDDEVFALTPFDRDGGAAEYAVVPSVVVEAEDARPYPERGDPLAGLCAWQALFDHGGLQRGERVIVTGARGGVGHFAVQLARWAGADVVDGGEADLVFDTTGPTALTGVRARRIVSVAKEAPGVTYFIVEPNRHQLV